MEFGLNSLKRKKINIQNENKLAITFMGMGGCNSYLAYELTQIASLSNKNINIIMMDSQNVIKKDVEIHKYLNKDIGYKRAEVTAQRCSSAFNIDVETFTKNIKSSEDILNLYSGRMGYLPIFICNNLSKHEMSCLKKAVDEITDAVVIIAKEFESNGEVNITYKENGIYLTKNYLEDNYEPYYDSNNQSKIINLELSKNIFLFLDEIISDKAIGIEQIYFNVKNKEAISKYIDGKEITFEKSYSKNEIKVETKENLLFIMIGVGGTGGSLAYELAHLANTSNKKIKLVCIDKDVVEAKNLIRQKFIMKDLNRYKSDVTVSRCKKSYNIDAVSMPEFITCSEDIYSIISAHSEYTPIILGCSDSLKLRYLICETIKKASDYFGANKDIVYIDAGNSVNSGQIIFTYIKDGKYITPDQFELFPQDLEDVDSAKLVTQMSCAELMVSAPQTKSANLSAAIGIYSYVHDIVYGNKINCHLTQFNNLNRKVISRKI